MSYFSVWLCQSVGIFVWTRWFSDYPMTLAEFAAAVWFSALALLTHWIWNRPKQSPCQNCSCTVGCVIEASRKETKT